MPVSLTREQLGLMARLGRTPEGQQLHALLKVWQSDVDRTLRTATGEALFRAQGDSQRLEELADLIAGGAESRLQSSHRPFRPVAQALT
jgi:dGTP triphosphohydrolase